MRRLAITLSLLICLAGPASPSVADSGGPHDLRICRVYKGWYVQAGTATRSSGPTSCGFAMATYSRVRRLIRRGGLTIPRFPATVRGERLICARDIRAFVIFRCRNDRRHVELLNSNG